MKRNEDRRNHYDHDHAWQSPRKTIELDEDPGIAEGQPVEITIKKLPGIQPWGEGLRRCAGALAAEWTEEDDKILEQIYQDRKRDTRREITE
jgi:hypothetical protein